MILISYIYVPIIFFKCSTDKPSDFYKGIESLPQTQIFSFLYLYNLMVKAFGISNLIILSSRIHSLKYLTSTTLGCKYIGIIKSEFVADSIPFCLLEASLVIIQQLLYTGVSSFIHYTFFI